MNRREFLLSLLSVPFGWKALFRKEVEEVPVEDSMQEEGESFYPVQGIYLEPDVPGTFAGLDKAINTGREVSEWQVVEDMDGCECPKCSGGLPLPDWVADGMRSGTYFERTVDIPLDPPPIPEWESKPRPMWVQYDDEVIYCPDIDVPDPQWYRRVEELSHYGETWELIT